MSNGTLKINLQGRYGNQLFIYFNARIFAEKNRLNLLTEYPLEGLKIKKPINFGDLPKNLEKIIINDNSYNSEKKCYIYKGKGDYYFDGYFQIEDIIYDNLDLIKSWIDYSINKKDIAVIHLRLGDFYLKDSRHLIISQDYYINCIEKYVSNYKEIIIICDSLKKPWEKIFMDTFKEKIIKIGKNPIYQEQSIINDYQSIIDSNLIITSNSTFCFWPMILSNASKIICFPYFGIDIDINNNVCKWQGNQKIFKYNNDKKYIFNYDFNKNIIEYFEKMYFENNIIIYYINLEKDKQRNIKIIKELDNLNININYKRIEGVNGEELQHRNLNNIMCDNIKFTRGQMGCYLSHIKCYENFLKTNNKYLIVLEDDIIIKKNFKNDLNKLLLFLKKKNDIDFVYLSRSKIMMTNQELPIDNKYQNNFIYSPQTCGYGFHSYLLTKNGCNKFLNILKKSEDMFEKNNAIPIDCLDRWLILGRRMNINLNVFSLKNEITHTYDSDSNTSNIL